LKLPPVIAAAAAPSSVRPALAGRHLRRRVLRMRRDRAYQPDRSRNT